jgi:hypothetical protein
MPDDPSRRSDQELLDTAIPIDLSEEDEADDDPSGQTASSHGDDDLVPIDIEAGDLDEDPNSASKIQIFGEAQRKAHADHWNRTPNATGQGAIHVKTFVAKLRLDAIDNLDEQVNNWLDTHPEYEVKFVTTSVGKLVGKISEDAIFMNVWV